MNPLDEVLQVNCPLCWARPGESCQRYYPHADHLARWLTALEVGRITQAHVAAVVSHLTVVARHVLVPEGLPAVMELQVTA